MTDTTKAAGHNESWRYNNRANTDTQTNPQPCMTNPTGLNGLNISPNSSDQRIGPKGYRCGEIGHMRHDCKAERVYCTICRSPNHDTKACRKYQNNNHSPHKQPHPHRISPHSNTTTTTRDRNNRDNRHDNPRTLVPE